MEQSGEADGYPQKARFQMESPPQGMCSCCSSLARESLKLGARPLSVLVSSSLACSGPSEEPTPSSPCDVAISTLGLKTTGKNAGRLDLHSYVAHPCAAPLDE